jgi:release factor glutamine methyltransferase
VLTLREQIAFSEMSDELVELLAHNGFVAPVEEAEELRAAAAGDDDRLRAMVERRLTGEPLAWITNTVAFCGLDVHVDPGVYVPRWHSEALAQRAAARAPERAIDLCTGSGAVAMVMLRAGATVVASDLDEHAVACARTNGVDAYAGDLFAPLPAGPVDVITAVAPYVPTPDLPLLQRDTFAFETSLAYDGGDDGLAILRRVIAEAPIWLNPGGALLLELGGRQAEELDLSAFTDVTPIHDDEGDVRGVEATRP